MTKITNIAKMGKTMILGNLTTIVVIVNIDKILGVA